MGLIYMITVNKKKYIGKTDSTVLERVKKHINNAKNNLNGYFYNALRKYNYEYTYIILEDSIYKNLNEREIFWIEYYNTFLGEGYNMTEGGDGGNTYENLKNPESTFEYRKNHTTIVENGENKEILTSEYNSEIHTHFFKGKITVKDLNTDITKLVSIEEYRSDDNLVHHSKGYVSCYNENGEKVRVTCEEYKSDDNLVYIQTGKKYSQKYKENMATTMAKYYYRIYNNINEIVTEGVNLRKMCSENNLPFNTIKKNSSTNEPLYNNLNKIAFSRLSKNGNIKYKGWNCIRKLN